MKAVEGFWMPEFILHFKLNTMTSLKNYLTISGLAFIILLLNLQETSACDIPAGLSSSSITSSSAVLSWSQAAGATGYKVRYRKTGITSWTTVAVSTNSKTLTGLTAGTSYDWKVLTSCSSGNSGYSTVLVFNTLCATPSGLSTTNISSASAQLNWSTTSCDSFLLRYFVTSIPGTVYFKTITPSTATNITISGLTAGTNYSWLIRTYCSGGQSGVYSSTTAFTTSGAACSAPGGLASSSVTSNGATLSWSAAGGALSYNVQFRIAGTSTWSATTSSATSKSLTGLTSGSNYEFQVQTVCSAGGNSAWSSSATFTTLTPCTAPSGLYASSVTANTASIGWNAAGGALSYNVQYRKTGTSSWSSVTSTTNSKTLSGLSPATTYEFQLQTVCSSGNSSWSSSVTFTTSNSSTLPVPDHIVVLIEENHGYSQIIGNTSAPYINALATDQMSTLFTQAYGIEHPSQPNYIDLFSGGNQGITNNNLPASHFTTANLARELINAGKTFKTFAQTLPSAGYDGTSSGKYMRKHNPITNWMGTGTNQVSSLLNQPFTAFPSDFTQLPTVSFVVPDLDYDMHDGTIAAGDTWFHNNLDAYVQWAKTHNSLFILIYDEDDGNYSNRIPMIFTGPMVKSGTVSTTYNHYNVLRTIEDIYGTTHAGNAASASAIHSCWINGYKESGNPDATADQFQWDVFPNPASDVINVDYRLEENTTASLVIYNNIGGKISEISLPQNGKEQQQLKISIDATGMTKGIYFLEVLADDKKYVKKVAVLE
jgi:hypothetical protein